MNTAAEENEIIGQLIFVPELLDSCDRFVLNEGLFSTPEHRKAFAWISKIWAEYRPKTIDSGLLAQEAGLPPTFVAKFLDGNYRPDSFNFARRVGKLAEKRSYEKARRLMMRDTETYEKVGEIDYATVDEIKAALNAVGENGSCPGPKASLSIQLSTIAPEPVSWLWPNYLPANKLVLISGDPGCGKTWFCLDLAARYSTGRNWPDSSSGKTGNVLILSCEDGAADTFRPRLDLLRADPEKIFLIQDPLDLSNEPDQRKFEREVNLRRPGMIIVDPIFDFSGGVNPNAGERVRAMITPIAGIAERARSLLIFTSHLNKASTMQALYRTSGSTSGWIGKARAAFLIVEDDEDATDPENPRRIFFPVKANLAPKKPNGWAYHITDQGLQYEPLSPGFNLEERLAPTRLKTAPRLDEAKALILKALKDGPTESKHIEEQAHNEGISKRTLQRAKGSLGVQSEKSGFAGKWSWSLE